MTPSNSLEPVRNQLGANDPGPRNLEIDRQNPDILVPPDTDNGSMPNLKFSFGMATTGWSRGAGRGKSPFANCRRPRGWPVSTCGWGRA